MWIKSRSIENSSDTIPAAPLYSNAKEIGFPGENLPERLIKQAKKAEATIGLPHRD
jgi:hypothetical protein